MMKKSDLSKHMKKMGQRGGLARAKNLTKQQRLESSRKANQAKAAKLRTKKNGRPP